jgi:SWI/SNF-related matrix-associated actin-dependent regulator 1 of chromatin subfamily A
MATVTIERSGARWIARCSYNDREVPKSAGFRWDPANRQWFTISPEVAAKLATPEAAQAMLAQHQAKQAARQEAIVLSRAADADLDLPCPAGLAYLPYQRAGIGAALDRPNVLFGDEMGLGKTIEAIGVINADATIKKILIICPASLKLNWRRELQKWLVRPLTIAIAKKAGEVGWCDITIINYDIAAKLALQLRAIQWDLLICDESHFLKNPDAKRTQAVVGREKKGVVEQNPINARRKIFLTGTPIPNRPIEGWTQFHYLAPEEFRSFFGFAKRYAAAYQNGYGWDFSGAANLPELQDKLRATIMIRRLKADVLTELPAKRRAVIEIEGDGASGAVNAELVAMERHEDAMIAMRARVELAKASADPADYATAVAQLKAAAGAAFADMSKLRHDTAIAKIPYVIEHVRDIIEAGEKVVVWCHHHDVIEALAAEFAGEAVTLYGEVEMAQRQANVDRFQSDPTCMLFIGGILAAGVGITLTAASHTVFAELDWVPGNVTQAEDRLHRIGQRDMVLVEHLVLEGSLDARMATRLVEKQEVIAAALDTEREEIAAAPLAPQKERAATESITRAKIAAEAEKMTPERIAAVHQGLMILAGMDGDYARELNGAGFSKIDVEIGHSLASAAALTARQAALGARLVYKYRRQLPEALVRRY